MKLGVRRVREQYLPNAAATSYTRVIVDGHLAGQAFACRWGYEDMSVCWITQLVVDSAYRERGLATGLLRSLRGDADEIYGIMSSQPAACLAAARAFGSKSVFPIVPCLTLNLNSDHRGSASRFHPHKGQRNYGHFTSTLR